MAARNLLEYERPLHRQHYWLVALHTIIARHIYPTDHLPLRRKRQMLLGTGRRRGKIAFTVRYRFAGNTLTFIYSTGSERDFELHVEEDGSVLIPSQNGILWWMVRLAAPEPYSKAFVDEHGQLQKLERA
jgi:hypothetical protein